MINRLTEALNDEQKIADLCKSFAVFLSVNKFTMANSWGGGEWYHKEVTENGSYFSKKSTDEIFNLWINNKIKTESIL